jgi:hypothetical protein
MTKDEALDLALEALEEPGLLWRSKKAITAIKQARSAPVQEPVAHRFNTADALEKAKAARDKPVTPVEYKPVISDVGSDSNMLWPDKPFVPKGTGKLTLHNAAPVQEPDHGDVLTIAYMSGLYDGKQKRAWVGLTRDEVLSIGKELGLKCKLGGNANIDFDYAEAIEAKLKEKNNG